MKRPSYRTWPSQGNRLVVRSALVLGAVACAIGCSPSDSDGPGLAEPVADEPVEVALEEAWSADLSAVRRTATDLGARAVQNVGTVEGVRAAREAASFARVLALRDPDAEWVGRARTWLSEAGRRRDTEGACEASMDLARLEARDAADLEEAYRVAFRTSLRFEGSDCAAEAVFMMQVLEPYRPPDAELAAIRADPHAEDPSAETEAEAVGSLNDVIATWARERAVEGERAILESMTVYGQTEAADRAASVRTVLRFDRVVAYEHGEAAARADVSRTTWLQLSGTSVGEGVESPMLVGQGGLSRIVISESEGSARVTFDLDEDAVFRSFVLVDPYRVVFDVEHGGPRAEGPVRLVVLDPGHGGDDFGARAFGMRESDLTLDLARRVRVLLARRLPDVQVVLTREDDTLVSLEERSAMANGLDADLFLSIHLNAADEEVDRGGVTTFVLDATNDRQVLQLAARENGTSVSEVSSLARLLASMHRADQVRESRAFADQVHRATLSAGRAVLPTLHDRGVKSAMFYVLVGARMPAVLLEASFLSREEEAGALQTVEYRQTLAGGIAEGIVRWVGE